MNQYRLTRRGKLIVLFLVVAIVYTIVIGFRLGISVINEKVVNQLPNGSQIEPQSSLVVLSTESTLPTDQNSSQEQTQEQTQEQHQTTTKSKKGNDQNKETKALLTSEDERILLNASTLIIFEQDKSDLSDIMKKEIREFFRTATAYSGFEVTVKGVALKLLDESKSLKNANLRASAVVEYLSELGLNPSIIKVETEIVNSSDYNPDQLSKAISAELYFTGYQKEVK